MGRKARGSVDPNRKFITISLLAEYLGVHRNTLRNHLKEYKKEVDFHDAFAVLDFILWNFGVNFEGGDIGDGD